METEQLYANGNPVCPTTNYENDHAAKRIRDAELLLEEIADRVANRLLEKADIAEWAKQASKPSYTAAETGADPSGSAQRALLDAKEYSDGTYRQATGYTDTAIARLIGSAPSTLDTLEEIARAMAENDSVVQALEAAVGLKASEAEFQGHAGNKTVHVTVPEKERWNKAADTAVPARVSELENDAGYAVTDSPAFTGTPTAPTPAAGTNNTQIATTAFVRTLIGNLVNGAPETLDTLKEIADALGENDEVVAALNAAVGKKVDKVAGKGLSTNDFTNAMKNKLEGIKDMTAATASAAGKAGLAPAPPKGAQEKYLRGDGTWVAPATTLAGTVPGIPMDQTMGPEILKRLEAINSNLIGLKKIQCGVAAASYDLSAKQITITFPESFEANPIVIAIPSGFVYTSHESYKPTVSIGLVTPTTVNINYNALRAGNASITWVAVGD